MELHRIVYNSIVVGLVTGLLLSVVQLFMVNPVIFAAEVFEVEQISVQSSGEHVDHQHSHETWAPKSGVERTLFTIVSNVLAGIGFAAVLLALMNQLQMSLALSINWAKGALWGFAGYLSVFVAPAIGLPLEIPGIQTAAIEHRQVWWVLTVLSVVIGLGTMAYTPVKMKAIGFIFLLLPYLVTAPGINGSKFQHSDPTIVKMLEQLHRQFIIASGVANLIFWLVMGIACALVLNRQTTHR